MVQISHRRIIQWCFDDSKFVRSGSHGRLAWNSILHWTNRVCWGCTPLHMIRHWLCVGTPFRIIRYNAPAQLEKILSADNVSARQGNHIRRLDIFLKTYRTLVKLCEQQKGAVAATSATRAISCRVGVVAGFVVDKDLTTDGTLDIGCVGYDIVATVSASAKHRYGSIHHSI